MSGFGKIHRFLLLCILLGLGLCASAATESKRDAGKLLIVGGALRSDNAAVYRAFIEAIPAEYPEVVIVPAASGRPAYYASLFIEDLRKHGFDGKVRVLPIAMVDDPATDKVNEGDWSKGGRDQELAASLKRVGGIWFVGGDQTRITQTLTQTGKDQGENRSANARSDLPVLSAIRTQLAKGAIIGGTSAGAAIMSASMIAAGDSLSALTLPVADEYAGMESQETGQLMLSEGLGFLPVGVVDQHFDRKARLGRLVRALGTIPAATDRLGFGVDEDTAILVDLAEGDMTVLGAGNLVLVDGRSARFSSDAAEFSSSGIGLSVMSAGDRYHWRTGSFSIEGGDTVNKEAFAYTPHQGAGITLPNGRLDQLLGFSLLDNRDSGELRRYSFDEKTGKGVLFRFRQLETSRGYWRYGSGTKDQYSVVNVALDIEPVAVTLSRR